MKPGERVGSYRIERRIGRGSMGVVYMATQVFTKARCALKVLKADQLESEEARKRFQNEVQSLVKLRGHPSIVALLDAGLTPDSEPFFVMELVEGATLREALTGRAPLPELLEALEQVARALHHAHGLGFVHRDVKPENVLLGADGVARLTDFGIAASILGTRDMTQTGSILGTLVYMAPEQANTSLGQVGPWSDAYSLGAVMYEALTGRPPLEGKSTMELLTKLLLQSGDLRPPRELAQVDPRIEAVCMKALAWKPVDRYRSLLQLADDLARVRGRPSQPRWAARHATLTAGTSGIDESRVPLAPAELAPARPLPDPSSTNIDDDDDDDDDADALDLPIARAVPETERTTVDPSRRATVLAARAAATEQTEVVRRPAFDPNKTREDEPDSKGGEEDEEEEDEDDEAPASRLVPFLAFLALSSLALVGTALFVLRSGDPGPAITSGGELDLGALRALLSDGKWDEAIAAAEAWQREHGPLEGEALAMVQDAHQRRVTGAYGSDDSARARSLLPEGWDRPFPELPWILALTGSPGQALAVCGKDVPPEQVARLAAWAGDEEACRAALERLSLDRARALRWELAGLLPALRPEPAARSLLPGEEPAEGWAAVARGEEALARGLVGIAAVAFDDAQAREGGDDGVKLQAHLGLARVELARGRFEQAADHLGEAFRGGALHPLDQARCFGWAAMVVVGLGKEPEQLRIAAGSDVLGRARKFAPGAPEVQTALWNDALLVGWVSETPKTLAQPRNQSRLWSALEVARAARREGKPPAAGQVSFLQAEQAACEQGLDGCAGLLLARAARLAALADGSGWRAGVEEAQQLLERAVRLRPASPALWLAQARVWLQLRIPERAALAVDRCLLLAPGDPEALLLQARVRRAALDGAAAELDAASCRGPVPADKAQAQAAALVEVLAAFRAARDAAPAAHELSRRARLGAAWTLLERARRLREGGQAEAAQAALSELEGELGPLLAGIDPAAVVAARTRLVRALENEDPRATEAAELALAEAAAKVDHPALLALLVGGLAGSAPRGEAWLGLAGDLPASAVLALRRAEGSADPAGSDPQLARARRLAPDLLQPLLAEELRRGAGREPGSYLRLARVLPSSSHLTSLVLGVVYLNERPPLPELLGPLEGAQEGPAWVAPLARALLLRTQRVFPAPPAPDPSSARLRELAHEADRLSTRGYIESRAALEAGCPGAIPDLLQAMFLASMAHGSPKATRCDGRLLPDARYHLACARAAAPWDPSVAIYWQHWALERIPETVDELLAMGFLNNTEALMRHYQGDKVEEALRELRDLLPASLAGEELARSVPRLQQDKRGALLALTLATLAAERIEAGQTADGEPPSPGAALAHVQATWQAQARCALARVRLGNKDQLAEAVRAGVRAIGEAAPGGEGLLLPPHALRAPGVFARIPQELPGRDALVKGNVPSFPSVGDVLWRLRRPEVALDVLAEATLLQRPPGEPPTSAGAPPLLGFSRGRALLHAVQEPPVQERGLAWLSAAGQFDEALLAARRAAAFSRSDPASRVFHRMARHRLRSAALAREGRERLDGLKLALVLAREARATSQRHHESHAALIAHLELDLAAVGPAEEADARIAFALREAQEAAGAKEVEVEPWYPAWAVVRACAALGESAPPYLVERVIDDAAVKDEIKKELALDPLQEKLRTVKELAPLFQ